MKKQDTKIKDLTKEQLLLLVSRLYAVIEVLHNALQTFKVSDGSSKSTKD